MSSESRPGPKPKRLYVRLVRGVGPELSPPRPGSVRRFVDHLESVGRLVAHGRLSSPTGDLLILRATSRGEAERALRGDPWLGVAHASYDIVDWSPRERGSGVNLDPPPSRGSGRLLSLQRIGIVVADPARAVAWYRDVLGLSVRESDAATGYVELSLAPGTTGMSLVAPRALWGEPEYSTTRSRMGGPTGVAFETDSVEALALRLRNARAEVSEAPRDDPWGGRSLRFRDLDGNEFLAFERPGARRAVRTEPPPSSPANTL